MGRTPRGTEWVVEADAAGVRLDKWLASPNRLGSRARAAEALLHGRVFLDAQEQNLGDGARRLAAGERVRVWLDRPGSASRRGPRRADRLDIVYEDEDVLVLVKPAGVLTVPLREQPDALSLADLVVDHWRSHRGRSPLAVHRIDRDTSGLVAFARTPFAQRALRDQFAQRSPERVYLAVVQGTPDPADGEWRTWLTWDPRARVQRVTRPHAPRGYEAVGRYHTLEAFGVASALAVRLETGKRHQIRVQAWTAGYPLIGERVYVGPPAAPAPLMIRFPRQALHAARLGFVHPRTGERLHFEAPTPDDMKALLARLREYTAASQREPTPRQSR